MTARGRLLARLVRVSPAPVAIRATRPPAPPRLPDRHSTGLKVRSLADERFLATDRWFWVSTTISSLMLVVFLGAAIPTFGWVPFLVLAVPGLLGSAAYLVGGATISPNAYALGHVAWIGALGVCAALNGGTDSFLLVLLAPTCLGFFGRLRPLVAAAYAWSAFALALLPVLVADWSGLLRSPWLVAASAAALCSITLFASQMARGELQQRGEATIDQLTGLLNRRGLAERLREIQQQAVVIGDDTTLAVLVCDLDHFKLVNDTYGHARGDDVLRGVAYIMRKQLRRFELAYRLGGEEFLVLLPGHDALTAYGIAEAIRSGIERGRPGGLDVTMSIGIASCNAATAEPDVLRLAADTALYEAKRAGRNRIVLAPDARAAATDQA